MPLATIERVVALNIPSPPHLTTHGAVAAMTKATDINISSAQRIWKAHGVGPTPRTPRLSNDPRFVDKLGDVVRIYIGPSAHVVVIFVDKKRQIQLLNRAHSGPPMKRPRWNHDA